MGSQSLGHVGQGLVCKGKRRALGTHHSSRSPSPCTCSSSAQACAGCAAAAAADNLQLPLSAICPLQQLLDELLQPQLGTGLPCCCLLQELVDLHHLPGPGVVSHSGPGQAVPNPLQESQASLASSAGGQHGRSCPTHGPSPSTAHTEMDPSPGAGTHSPIQLPQGTHPEPYVCI